MIYCPKCRKDTSFIIGTINHPDLGEKPAYVCSECKGQIHKDLKEPPTKDVK